jgi:hypothetical protein
MFSKLGSDEWTLYLNRDRIDFIGVKPINADGEDDTWCAYIVFSSGSERAGKTIYEGSRAECEEFVERLLASEMGMQFTPRVGAAFNATLGI